MNKNILLNVKILILSLIFPAILFAAQGDLDTTFNPIGTPPGTVTTDIGTPAIITGVAIQSDGKIVVAGSAIVGAVTQFAVARYNTNGTLDTTFNQSGSIPGVVTTVIGANSVANGVAIQSDGKIVAIGTAFIGLSQFAVARYNTNGILDTTFNSSGAIPGVVTTVVGTSPLGLAVSIQSDGKIVAAGRATIGGVVQFAVARYNTNGILDTTFNSSGLIPGVVTTPVSGESRANSVAIQFDGKIVAAGYAAVMGGMAEFALARYDSNGILDATFGTGGTVITQIVNSPAAHLNEIKSIAIQSDGKIVAVGTIRDNNLGLSLIAIARYNTNGSLDATFNPSGTPPGTLISAIGNSSEALGVAMQSDGKIVLVGSAIIGGIAQFLVGRYNTDGTLDTTFNSSGSIPGVATTAIGTSSVATGVAIQSDGKIVAGGSATIGTTQFAVARYLANSTLIQSLLTIAIKNKYCGNGA